MAATVSSCEFAEELTARIKSPKQSWREAVFLPLAFISLSFAPKYRETSFRSRPRFAVSPICAFGGLDSFLAGPFKFPAFP